MQSSALQLGCTSDPGTFRTHEWREIISHRLLSHPPLLVLTQPPSFFSFCLILLCFLSTPPRQVKKGGKNHIFLTFLPEVALARAQTAAISAFHTLLTHRGTDRRCSSLSLKLLPSHAGWLDHPPPTPHFVPRYFLASKL